jgi:hypothetical protein
MRIANHTNQGNSPTKMAALEKRKAGSGCPVLEPEQLLPRIAPRIAAQLQPALADRKDLFLIVVQGDWQRREED